MTQENIPVKYSMNIWKSLPGYPTKLDVLYEIYSHLFKNSKSEFSEQTLNGIWFDDKGVANWRGTKYEHYFIELQKDSTIRESKNIKGKSWMIIEEKHNPFI
jgi:hypothetical protein